MSDPLNVAAFHEAGSDEGALLGVYEFNARAIDALAPPGATLVDLGCGSGQCLAHLARRRPDLRIVGLDLSAGMIAVGGEMLAQRGIAGRVSLRVGDMTDFQRVLPDRVDVITSIFSLHHLPSAAHLGQCLQQIELARAAHGPAIWIFDHARPRRRRTAAKFPAVFTPTSSPAFNEDSTNSLRASWTFEELSAALQRAMRAPVRSSLARFLPLYQVHWVWSDASPRAQSAGWDGGIQLPKVSASEARGLAGLFAELPQRHK